MGPGGRTATLVGYGPKSVTAKRRARSDGKVKYTEGLEWSDVPVEYEDGTKSTIRVVLTREDESASDESKEGLLVVDPKDSKRVLNRYPVPAPRAWSPTRSTRGSPWPG